MGSCRPLLLAAALICGCKDRETRAPAPPPTRPAGILQELEALPVGLTVVHTPARVANPGGPNARGWKYTWSFKTEVSAVGGPVTIDRFGILAWDGSHWLLPEDQSQYNSGVLGQREFVEWYRCPDARVSQGSPAVDPENWAGSHTLLSFKQKWFYIGTDDRGRRCKGEAVVELAAP